jgi:hypothetical protein
MNGEPSPFPRLHLGIYPAAQGRYTLSSAFLIFAIAILLWVVMNVVEHK